jgi:hypothetical protein
LLDDDASLRTDDRRTLALAFGTVLDETRATPGRVVWTVALYCTMWLLPKPTTKPLSASLIVLLMGYLGLETVYGLMDGWARLADTAHHASSFEELRAAGKEFGRVLGEDAARAMILAVATTQWAHVEAGAATGEVASGLQARGETVEGAGWCRRHGARGSDGDGARDGGGTGPGDGCGGYGGHLSTGASGRGDVQDEDGQWDDEGLLGAAPRKPSFATGVATGRYKLTRRTLLLTFVRNRSRQ